MSIINVETLKPKSYQIKVRHPVSGSTSFVVTDDEGNEKEVEGIITVVGTNSNEFYEASKRIVRSSKFLDGDVEEIEQDNIRALAACIIGWEDNGFFSKPYAPEEALELMTDPETSWLKDQVQEVVLEKAHFFRAKNKPSS